MGKKSDMTLIAANEKILIHFEMSMEYSAWTDHHYKTLKNAGMSGSLTQILPLLHGDIFL